MTRWSRILHDATHSRRVLWRFAFVTVALGLAIGYAWHRWSPGVPPDLEARILTALSTQISERTGAMVSIDTSAIVLGTLERELTVSPHPFEEVLDLMPSVAHWAPSATRDSVAQILEHHYTDAQSQLGASLYETVSTDDDAALARLQREAASASPPRYSAHAAGLAHLARGEYRTAYTFFAQEGQHPDADGSRRKAIECLIATEDFERIRALADDPAYSHVLTPGVRLNAAIEAKDWAAILRLVPVAQFTHLDPAMTGLALLTGLAWAFFLLQLGQAARLERGAIVLCLLALAAGVLSTTPTIYSVIWQDDFLGFSEDGDTIQVIFYCIGGVGVREEVCKLVLFLPFLPILLRRGDELEALLVASFVGLGFAMEENGNYFLESAGAAAAGRFLTANFFHIVMTGMSGHALFRACARGWGGMHEFLTVFGGVIVAHGAYDALLSLPELEVGGYLAMAVYVMTCQFYFTRAHALRDPVRSTISLSAAFVAGIATLSAAMIIYQMAHLGPVDALMVVAPELIGTIVLLAMFFREFNEPLSA